MQTIESLRDEKARLVKEIERVESEIDKHDEHNSGVSSPRSKKTIIPASKSGYLFKWQDRQIGWGGTKWDLRFVKLDKGRFGYFKDHNDTAPRYLLTLQNCAIRDDGSKPNKRFRCSKENEKEVKESTPGAFFHVFSLYQRPKGKITTLTTAANLDEDDNIVPLLRFSTNSLAEKVQWMDLLIESCAYCDSDDFDMNEAPSFVAHNGSLPTSITHTKGTLSPLYFESPTPVKIGRTPSHSHLLTKRPSHLKLNLNKDSAKSNSRKKNDYPPSKPMHRRAEGSYLSHDSPTPNYRGLLNLGFIILVISNFRILLGTMREYGFVLTHGFFPVSEEEYSFTWKDVVDVPFVFTMAILNVFVIFAYFIELGTSRKFLKEWLGISLHVINTNLSLLIPMVIVWKYINSPVNGAVLQMTSTVLWMKLISYAHANADYRHFPDRNVENIIQNTDEESTSLSYPR